MCGMMATTGALTAGSARQPSDADLRRAIGMVDESEVEESRRCWEFGTASSGKLWKLDVLPSNKPLQRTTAPPGNRSNIIEPFVRRCRR